MDKRAGITFFRRKLFVSQCRKKLRGPILCSNEILLMTTLIHTRSASQFCRFFVSQYRKFVGRTIVFHNHSGMEKKTIVKGVVSRVLVKNFLSRSAESTRKGDPCVSETFCYGKKVWITGSVSRFSDESFLSHSAGTKTWRKPSVLERNPR